MFYTRKGDKGLTNLFGCAKKFSKSSPVIEALGALDELNSLLGFCKMKTIKHPVFNSLKCVAITCLSRRQKKNINPESLKYLNRLSSLLFVLARYANHDIKEKHPKY